MKTVAELQAVPMDKLLAAVTTKVRTAPDFGPVVDKQYLPADMFEPVAAPSSHGIPIIVGSNRDEYALYAREHPHVGKMTEAQLREDLTPMYGAQDVEALITAYRQSRPQATPWDLMVAIRSNRFHIGPCGSRRRRRKSRRSMSTALTSSRRALKAAHGAEIAFVFSNATANPNARPGAKAVEDAMSDAWIAFARSGNPNHPGMPTWPTYDARTRAVMVFDAKTEVLNDPRASERTVWEGKTLVR